MEFELLSRLRHTNVLDLIGFCVERGELRSVYDYIPNDIFFGNTEIQLDWGNKVGIVLQFARALAYLHNDAKSTRYTQKRHISGRESHC
jgi:hypothetical protein